ncbi:MAG: class IV adenylate cyclase [Thermoanaerobaculales bacterium]|nr:class IV adenylate cyclase [Thermoanaerobaculales bacterium]
MIESELKIPVADLEPVARRLDEIGGRRLHAAELEVNILFDTDGGRLAAAREVLRIRRAGTRTIVTYKGPASWQGAVKQRREIELDVSAADDAAQMLHALGFLARMRYEKIRESWEMGAVRIDLDRTPMGDFVEVEGPPEELESAARQLGLDVASAVAGSYVSLWHDYRELHPEAGPDMVFDP